MARVTKPVAREEGRPAIGALSVEAASSGMVSYRLVVDASDVVFVKGVVEACDGLGVVFADAGGELFVATPVSREPELAGLLADLARELDVAAPSKNVVPARSAVSAGGSEPHLDAGSAA